MSETLAVALVFAVLLGLAWRYPRRRLRLGTIALALLLWVLAQPSLTVAGRQASAAGPGERSTQLRGEPLSEYMSGVDTMRRFMLEQIRATYGMQLIAVGALAWLACTPAFRRSGVQRHAAPPAEQPSARGSLLE